MEDRLRYDFGIWLREHRKYLGYNQKQMAEILKINYKTYSAYESSIKLPRIGKKIERDVLHLVMKKQAKIKDSDVLVRLCELIKGLKMQKQREFGFYVRKMREAADIEIWEMADLLNVDEITLMDYEEGYKYPAYDEIFLEKLNRVVKSRIREKRRGKHDDYCNRRVD